MHAEMWRERLHATPQFTAAVDDLWPYAVGLLPEGQRDELAARVSRELPRNSLVQGKERGAHTKELSELWDEMTMVRRSAPTGAQW